MKLTLEQIRETLDSFSEPIQGDDPKARTRARILRVATEHFQTYGYRRCTIDGIARDSGVAKGTIYLYFPSKQRLLYDAMVEEKRRFLSELVGPVMEPDLSPDERLRRYIEAAFHALDKLPLMSRIARGDKEMLLFLEDLGEAADEHYEVQMKFVLALLEGVTGTEDLSEEELHDRARVLINIAFNAAHLLEERFLFGLSEEKFISLLARMLVAGLGSPSVGAEEEPDR